MTEQSKYHQTKDQLDTEAAEVEAAKKDPAQFEVLYNRYYEQIFRYLYHRLDSKEEAFDLTSEVFLKAMLNLSRFEYKGVPFSSWLYKIAFNELNQAFRANKVKRTINIDSTSVHEIIEEMEEGKEDYKPLLRSAINSLSDTDLNLVEMRFFEKRPFKEIGNILEITENNAKVKLYRVLDNLREMMPVNTNNYERI
ncbi:MAG TPA: sigma-70 family RNA polymerase sigma factor [Flavobacteriales bacterium]|nr:sigma-70 family RNA polymerase sigma factor [Flavobacteriales bacterium]